LTEDIQRVYADLFKKKKSSKTETQGEEMKGEGEGDVDGEIAFFF